MQLRRIKLWFSAFAVAALCLAAVSAPRDVEREAAAHATVTDDSAARAFAAAGETLVPPVDPPQDRGPFAFRHGSHLSPTWTATPRSRQFAQHCKVCHDYDRNAPLGLVIPTDRCAQCHCSDPGLPFGNASRLVFSGGDRQGPPSALAFDHGSKTHSQRACTTCHSWTELPRGDFLNPDVRFAMPKFSACAECHEHGSKDPAKSLQDGMTAGAGSQAAGDVAAKCAPCHKAGAPRTLDNHRRKSERGFTHAAHLPQQGGACNECHAMDGAAATSGNGVLLKECADCHFGADGSATTEVVEDLEVARMPTQFTHATDGHRGACATCHPTPAGDKEPVVQRMYADCTKTCHAERRVERHGLFRCSECHRSGQPSLQAGEAAAYAIKTVAVQRPTEGSRFAFAKMLHPGITAQGAAVHAGSEGRACSDCHRHELNELEHAAKPRAFRHDAHLANTATAKDHECQACHLTLRDTASSDQVLAFQEQSTRERRTCTQQCHQSREFAVTAQLGRLEVPAFSHARHSSTACVECHASGGDITALRTAGLRDAGAAFSCARCHGHKDEKKIAITGGYAHTAADASCGACHAPRANPSYELTKRSVQRLQLVAGATQFHDKSGECAACHELDRERATPSRTPVLVTSIYDPHKPHRGVRLRNGGVGDIAAVETDEIRDPKNCRSCHASDPLAR